MGITGIGSQSSYYYNVETNKLVSKNGDDDAFVKWYNGEMTQAELPGELNGFDQRKKSDIQSILNVMKMLENSGKNFMTPTGGGHLCEISVNIIDAGTTEGSVNGKKWTSYAALRYTPDEVKTFGQEIDLAELVTGGAKSREINGRMNPTKHSPIVPIATYQKALKRYEEELCHPLSFFNGGRISCTEKLRGAENADAAANTESYMKYLQSKYGSVTIKDVPKDQKTLEKLGKSMSGNDVVIAPNILEQMANDPEKAAYYEQKIDYFFDTIIPRETALCAARGLVFEPAGVVVHKDGTVTYICGCSDSPERVAQVNAINKAKQEKRAAMRKAAFERSQEEADRRAANEIMYLTGGTNAFRLKRDLPTDGMRLN